MTPPHAPDAERAIEILRQIQELVRSDIANATGGELSQETLRLLSYWIARAWEAGCDYERQRTRR